jgi:hypothetical protein
MRLRALLLLLGIGAATAGVGARGAPYRMTVNMQVDGDPSEFDGTQRHAFLAAFARVAKLGYQIGDLHWDPGHFDASRGRAQITAIKRKPPKDRMAAADLTVDVTVDTFESVAKGILALTESPSFAQQLSESFNAKEFAHETRFSAPDLLPRKQRAQAAGGGGDGGAAAATAPRRIAMNLQLVGLTTSTFTEAKREQLLHAFGAVAKLGYVAGTLHDPLGVARSRGTVRINWASAGKTAVSTVVCGLEMRVVGDAAAQALLRQLRSFGFRRALADAIADSPGGDAFGVAAEDLDTSDVREVLAGGATVELFSHRAARAVSDLVVSGQDWAAVLVIGAVLVLAAVFAGYGGVRGRGGAGAGGSARYARVEQQESELEGGYGSDRSVSRSPAPGGGSGGGSSGVAPRSPGGKVRKPPSSPKASADVRPTAGAAGGPDRSARSTMRRRSDPDSMAPV